MKRDGRCHIRNRSFPWAFRGKKALSECSPKIIMPPLKEQTSNLMLGSWVGKYWWGLQVPCIGSQEMEGFIVLWAL